MCIPRCLKAIAKLIARFTLAVRYYTRLDYTWHLAWTKAER